MSEVWRACSAHDRYEVSNLGRVRNRLTGHVLKPTQNFSRGGRRPGYLKVSLGRVNGKVQNHYVHHLVAAAWLPPRPPGHDLDHESWDRLDCSVANLRWMPMHENRMRWTPDGFVSKKHDDREVPEDHEPMTEQEQADVYRELEHAGW